MRVIAGYDDLLKLPERHVQLHVTAGPAGGPFVDVTSAVKQITVQESLERQAGSATIERARGPEAWSDPMPGVSSPLADGNLLLVEMQEGEFGWIALFQGQIASGGTSSQNPASRGSIQALAGNQLWWRRPVTSEAYTAHEIDAIIEHLFTDWGGLAPGDFDLPGISRVLASLQVKQRTLMDVAFDLYEPLWRVPYWDPATLKLSTLDVSIPGAADAVIEPMIRGDLNVGWAAPEATRVALSAGVLSGITRVEIGGWTTPVNFIIDYREEGVVWARGSKGDPVMMVGGGYECYWALADGTDRQGPGVAWPGALYFLWVNLVQEYGFYWGPEGVRFLTNDPMISTDAVSIVAMTGALSAFCIARLMQEGYSGTAHKQYGWVSLVVDADGALPAHPPTGHTAYAYWQDLVGAEGALDFEVWGRQAADDSAEQLTAQDWDAALMAQFGDRVRSVQNATLALLVDPYTGVEVEVQRQKSLAGYSRYPASVNLKGLDLRLQPGDVLQTPHPRDACDVLLWVRSVGHGWSDGRASTDVSGYIVGIV